MGFSTVRRFGSTGIGVLLAVLICWIALSITAVRWQGTWLDETNYILKSWWYVSGAVKPYSAEDATWYQPLFFYALGSWQWIFGHGVISARTFSLVVTAINIGLVASLLHRLGCTVWPIAFAVVVFALNEDSIFYFNSATQFAAFVCLQLITLHLLLLMNRSASVAVALALGAVLTMNYLLRINSVAFIALSLAIVWVRAGRDRWRVYICSAAILVLTWSLLVLLWGKRFAYITVWLPGVTDSLVQAGLLPKLYPYAMPLSRQIASGDAARDVAGHARICLRLGRPGTLLPQSPCRAVRDRPGRNDRCRAAADSQSRLDRAVCKLLLGPADFPPFGTAVAVRRLHSGLRELCRLSRRTGGRTCPAWRHADDVGAIGWLAPSPLASLELRSGCPLSRPGVSPASMACPRSAIERIRCRPKSALPAQP